MLLIIKLIAFLLWCNLLPPLARRLAGEHFKQPLDGGRLWLDGRPLFGPHKTIGGLLVSVVGGTAVFPLLGTSWQVAAGAAALAMAGDLLSSFIKRRRRAASGEPIFILDQLFEGLLPTIFLSRFLPLPWWQATGALIIFIPLAYAGARLWTYILYQPPLDNYLRIIRSTVRLREWRASHLPLVRWQSLLTFSNFIFYRILLAWIFKATGLYGRGVKNALAIRLTEETFWFPDLPAAFDGFRLLLLTDLHLDGLDGLTEAIIAQVRDLEADSCLIGGDIRMEVYGAIAPAVRQLRRLLAHIRARHGIYGVLGNHDCIEMVPDFEEAGMLMLINDSWALEVGGEKLWLVGVDDPHYYKLDDAAMAFRQVPAAGFKIFLAHSPEAYAAAAKYHPRLYLCGHTHGGQVCLPGRRPLFTNCKAPRYMATGRWRYQGMWGYTSRGAGSSGVPLRFNCPGEITLLTLRKGAAKQRS